jgi:RNA polymerase sigma-32 factor
MAREQRQPGKRTTKARKKQRPEGPAKPPPRKRRAKKSDPEPAPADAPEPVAEAEPDDVVDADAAAEPEVLPPEGADATLAVPVRDLTHADALQRYMAEVSRHPLLSREEEHDLAVKFQKTQDPAIAYRLVTANLRLVVKIAHEYRRAAFNLLDLVQEGNVGLMHAVQKYDPYRGVKLSSYAAWWIRAYILRYLMDNWRMVKLGTTQAQRKLFFNLRKEQERLLAQGFDAQPKLLAERLDVTEQDVREMDQRLGNDEFSLDTPVAGGDEMRQTYADRLAESSKPAEEQLADEELRRIFKEKLAEFGKTLTDEKDKFLFEHRLAAEEPMTLQAVGDRYGFTRERARQLEARLTDRLREFLRKELPDFAELSVNPPDES